jgi:hypothetical protein
MISTARPHADQISWFSMPRKGGSLGTRPAFHESRWKLDRVVLPKQQRRWRRDSITYSPSEVADQYRHSLAPEPYPVAPQAYAYNASSR